MSILPSSNSQTTNDLSTDFASNALVVAGVPEHFNLPWHLAIESGKFDRAGIRLKYCDAPGGTGEMTNGLLQKTLDVAIVLAEGGVASLLQGNPSRIVKTYVESPLIWGIHVAADSKIQKIEQIKNGRYAISRFGSGSHLMSIVDASERGWPTNKMNFHEVQNLDGAREALANGDADTFFWERFTTAPLVRSGEFRCVGVRQTLWPAFVICVRDEVLAERADDIKTVLEIVNDSCQELMDNAEACEIIAQRYRLSLMEVEDWFAMTKWSTDFNNPVEAIDTIRACLLKLNLITESQSRSRTLWHDLTH